MRTHWPFGRRPESWSFLAALLLVIALPASAAAPPAGKLEGDNKRFEGVVAVGGDDKPGAKLFANACAACHVQGADPKAPHRDMLRQMSPESIMAALTVGAMKQQGMALSAAERQDVAEFLASRPLGSASNAVAPVMCQGAAKKFNYGEPPAWDSWGISRTNSHSIPAEVSGINPDNVGRLKLKWAFAFPDANRVRSQPTPAGGALYVGSHNGQVYALDRQTGCVRWAFRAGSEVRTGIVVSPWRAGDRKARPAAYFGDFLGNVYAVDAVTGKQLWRVRPDNNASATITAAPALFEGRLYVSVSSLEVIPAADPKFACCHFRGSVRALDPATGKEIWRTHTIKEEPVRVGANSIGTDIFAPSGAPVWNTVAIDAARRRLYFGTGENYSSPANGSSDAVMALDMDSGAVKWVYQGTADDAFNAGCLVADQINCPVQNGPDVDFGSAVIYDPTARAGGIVMAGQKNGIAHALDPETGALVWKTRVGRGGVVGGIHFGMASGEGRLYVPITDTPDNKQYPNPPRPGVFALDVATGRELWAAPMQSTCGDRPLCYPGISQTISTTPGLVFAGGIDGTIRIYGAEDGKIRWQADTTPTIKSLSGEMAHGGGMSGGAAPVAYRGMLFVSSGYAFAGLSGGNLLMAYEVSPP